MSAGPRDPFALTADVSAYVARPATEAAFAALVREVLEGGGVAVLTGPSGLGKTLLLRRLAAGARDGTTPIYLPYAALGPDELCTWILAALDSEPTEDPIGLVRTYIRHLQESDSRILLVVDDAAALPPPTARWLAHLASGSKGAVCAALAAADGAATERMVKALGEGAVEVRLDAPMNETETRAYLAAKLGREAVTPDERSIFDDDRIALLQRVSEGVPQRLHAAAAALLRGERPEEIGEFHDGVVAEGEGAQADAPVEAAPAIAAPSDGAMAAEEAAIEPAPYAPPGEATPARVGSEAPVAESAAPPDPASSEPGGGDAATGLDPRQALSPPEPDIYRMRPPPRRVEPAPALRWVLIAALLVAGAAVTIPLMRAQVGSDTRGQDSPGATAPFEERRMRPEPAPIPESRAATPEPPAAEASPIAAPAPIGDESVAARVETAGDAPAVEQALDSDPSDSGRVAEEVFVDVVDEAAEPPAVAVREVVGEPVRAAAPEFERESEPESAPALEALPELVSEFEPELTVAPDPAPDAVAEPVPDAAEVRTPAPVTGSAGPFSVSINATPWANIEVDGIDVGITPIGAVPLLAGPHTFKARMPDGRVIERVVEISAEERFVAFE